MRARILNIPGCWQASPLRSDSRYEHPRFHELYERLWHYLVKSQASSCTGRYRVRRRADGVCGASVNPNRGLSSLTSETPASRSARPFHASHRAPPRDVLSAYCPRCTSDTRGGGNGEEVRVQRIPASHRNRAASSPCQASAARWAIARRRYPPPASAAVKRLRLLHELPVRPRRRSPSRDQPTSSLLSGIVRIPPHSFVRPPSLRQTGRTLPRRIRGTKTLHSHTPGHLNLTDAAFGSSSRTAATSASSTPHTRR